MRIERINYQKVFPAGSYLTERIGFEASLEEGEDQRSAIEQMRQMAEDIHREKYPHYYEKKTVDTPHQEEPSIQLQEVEMPAETQTPEWKRWEAITAACFRLPELQKWKGKCPEAIYNAREAELSLKEQLLNQ
jgi:DNA primase